MFELLHRRRHAILVFAPTLALAECAGPSTRIATVLTVYGLDQREAQCVGDRLEAKLSIGQLQQLGRAARTVRQGDTTPARLTVGDLNRVASRFDDAHVPPEVSRAAIGYGVLTGTPRPYSPES